MNTSGAQPAHTAGFEPLPPHAAGAKWGSGDQPAHTAGFEPPVLLERAIAELAGQQYGVISLSQLVERGMSADAARKRVTSGRLHRVHRGVFAVGHAPLTLNGRFMAAVLACGRDAALSYRSSGHLIGLRPSARGLIDVTSPRRAGRGHAGIDAHTSTTLLPHDIATVDGIRCTSVALTLLDLAEVVDRRALERACEQAAILQLFDMKAVDDVLARANGRRGANRLAAVLAELRPGSTLTRQQLEERFLALCRSTDLPWPEVNAWIALAPTGCEADFMWRAPRLDVELDGRDVHMTAQAFERDRLRDQRLMSAGWRVVRFTGRQLADDPQRVVATVRALLKAAPANSAAAAG